MKKEDINIKKRLILFKSVNDKNYENLDLDRLVIYTFHFLEENKIPLYFDYISVALFKLFPQKFSMANFKQYPDTNRISKSLRRITDQKRKGWATGNIENGFYITELGRETAMRVKNLIFSSPWFKKEKLLVSRRSRGRSPEDDVNEIKRSGVFQKWQQKNYKITNYEIISFLRAMPHTPKNLLKQYLDGFNQSVVTIKDKEVRSFLKWLEKKFYNLFY